jgi:hypothetical protein
MTGIYIPLKAEWKPAVELAGEWEPAISLQAEWEEDIDRPASKPGICIVLPAE